MDRRKFIQKTAVTGVGIASGATLISACKESKEGATTEVAPVPTSMQATLPISISTWNTVAANTRSGNILDEGKPALDALIAGVAIEEADPKNTTVGIGATPDRDGHVTLDACVMSPDGDYGAVLACENIVHVAALARKVMEDTPHVILAGEGAEQFAYSQGFKKEKLLTEHEEKVWRKWLETSDYQPEINVENHDTIGMLAMDKQGDIAGVCTTSGLGYKMRGRVGDSPIIGAGLFVDNEVGGAVATGLGEEVLKTVGSFLIVELMRNGMSPQQACEEAIRRIVRKNPKHKDFQVAYIALNKKGETGAYCIHPGFSMMKYENGENTAFSSDSELES